MSEQPSVPFPPNANRRKISSTNSAGPYAALRLTGFRSYLCGNLLATIGMQMLAVAVGWELYETTNSATILGLAGLFQVLPILLLAIPAGRLVDHFNRKRLLLANQILLALSAAALGCATMLRSRIPDWPVLHTANAWLANVAAQFHDHDTNFTSPHLPIMLALLFLNGVVRSVNQPVKQALIPQLVPARVFHNAVTWNTTVVESSTIVGPAVAGILLAVMQSRYPASPAAYALVYFLAALGQLGQWLFLLPVKVAPATHAPEPLTVRSVFSGVAYVWRTKVILGVITLDLFGVLFGGATALLPMFARDILHCGPAGLGWLRAAPSLGACLVAVVLAHRPPLRQAGRTLLFAVAGFGLATVGFGLSQNFYLSLACLLLVGACDNTSVIIRQTVVQLLTPDPMRGRVSAVKSLFSSASNGLGALESGLTAALLGPVLSVVGGGAGSLLVVLAVAAIWPQVRRFGTLQPVVADNETERGWGKNLIAQDSFCAGTAGDARYSKTSPVPRISS
ncbi:MAG TPA: MFS transporter [Opitutales bacterium]|nr:MFS transporter [Opitutales bacterium]